MSAIEPGYIALHRSGEPAKRIEATREILMTAKRVEAAMFCVSGLPLETSRPCRERISKGRRPWKDGSYRHHGSR